MFGFSRTLLGMKLTVHEKTNDDRRTLYLGSRLTAISLNTPGW